ncbi:DNA polymerase III subunit beta [Sandaracinus amylolyticus]|uniref:Beta sliding clamp n=1 Tax=Sandaracinus amylolyticus TaxID=927083 RepID=A0A0F6WAD5_9BACT|nr:DNA polymerase III subunit beta [Sandaracinus amylolyticus]AKF11421.1 DNA polymerase III beta subunit [Sandaracinus amylolyticus]
MELTISKRNFLRGLARTHGVADRKSSMPILSNILLTTEDTGTLRFAATDLYLGVAATAPAEIKKGGSIAVAARTLFDIVKNLPDGDVQWTVGPNHAAEIRSGKVRFRIPGMPGDDFPPLPAPREVEFSSIDVDVLADLITKTSYSMSTDDTRPHLAGALFEGEGRVVRMVTTDGHRLSKCEHKLREGASMVNFTMLVPNKGIAELKRLLEDAKADKPAKGEEAQPVTVGVATQGGNAFFRREGIQLSVKLADEQFPPYAKVIPQNQDKRVVCPRASLVESLRRISLVSSDKSGGVRLMLQEGSLRVVSENPDVGEGSEELDVDYAGDPLTIGFNAKYIQDVLASLSDDEVALELSGELDPGVIKPANDATLFVGVVMPMRI